MCTLDVTADQVLLLFNKGASVEATVTIFGTIPPTDGDGLLHVAFVEELQSGSCLLAKQRGRTPNPRIRAPPCGLVIRLERLGPTRSTS